MSWLHVLINPLSNIAYKRQLNASKEKISEITDKIKGNIKGIKYNNKFTKNKFLAQNTFVKFRIVIMGMRIENNTEKRSVKSRLWKKSYIGMFVIS